ncbi:MAG TPA: hypothetical protein DD622_01250 [Opitutae bacterium]|nr:hypothetical protein [Opitutae bacterium]
MTLKDKFVILIITVFFVISFFLLRVLPDAQCGFLHYEEVTNEDGSIEFCATNHAGFLDLERIKYPLKMELVSSNANQSGKSVTVDLLLETSGGTAIASHELAKTHTKKMHLMLIDRSLEDYHHVHPDAVDLNGRYRFSFLPKRPGSYRAFAEIVPLRTRRQMIASSMCAISGTSTKAKFKNSRTSLTEGVRFSLQGIPKKLYAGRDYKINLDVSNENGSALQLEDIMGAPGHMVAFDEAGRGFAHMHPTSSIIGAVKDDESLSFLFNVPNSGWYRLFAQVKVKGHEVFGRFDLYLE